MVITLEQIYAVMPGAKSSFSKTNPKTRAEVYLPHLNQYMAEYGIDTPLRIQHFLATIAVESGELRYTEELASGAAYDTGRKAVMLGNTPAKDGDGQMYKGRGLIQLTGRSNYMAYSKDIGFDFYSTLSKAKGVAQPANAVRSACWFWKKNGLNTLADRDDANAVRRRVNGGTNGLAMFKTYLSRAKKAVRLQ